MPSSRRRALIGLLALLALAEAGLAAKGSARGQPAPTQKGAPPVESIFPGIIVGPNVHVTPERSGRRSWELGTCADPNNPDELAASVMYDHDGDFPVKVGVWTSHDRGRTWQLAFDNPRPSIDPSCAYGPDGRLYALNMVSPTMYEDYGVILHRSGDRGKTWTSTTRPAERGWWLDRPWIAVDNGTGPFRGRAYFNAIHFQYDTGARGLEGWSRRLRHLVFRSSDGGATLAEAIIPGSELDLDPKDPMLTLITGQTAVLAGGTVVATLERPGSVRSVSVSTDGGRTFTSPQVVGGVDAQGEPRRSETIGHTMPMVAVDNTDGPFRDRVYVVWTEKTTGRNQMWLTYSTDRTARKWAEPQVIDDAMAASLKALDQGPHTTNPAIAVNPNGVVAIVWADRRGLPAPSYRARFMASRDGGETWSRSVPVADRPSPNTPTRRRWSVSNLTRATGSRPWAIDFLPRNVQIEPGQFWGMSADAGGAFHPVWIDDRTGIQQAWAARVDVEGAARKLEDVTERIRVRLENTTYSEKGLRLSVDVKLLNASDDPIAGPFLLKWIDPAERGSVTGATRDGDLIALNADNRWGGPGAVWQLTSGSSGLMRPGETTAARRFEYRLREAKPETQECCKDLMIFRVFVPAK